MLHPVGRKLIKLFLFQGGKKALHTCVIVTMCSSAETLDKSRRYKSTAKRIARILTASVAVQNSSFEPAILLTKLFYGIYTKLFLHIIMHFKSNDLAIEAVENRRNIELSVGALNPSDVGQ